MQDQRSHSRREFLALAGLTIPTLLAVDATNLIAGSSRATPSSTPSPDARSFDALTSWFETSMSDLGIPGAAVGVFHGDEVHAAELGVTEAGTEDPFTTTTQFGIASLTKIFTATALASLVHDGALSFNDPVRQHIPEFSLADAEATEDVTIGHLLSHAGGWADVLEPVPGQDALDWYASRMESIPQTVPVGTHFSYSNSGFMLAGAIIEQLAGASYEDVISQSILAPLGMNSTRFPLDFHHTANRAAGHQVIEGRLAAIPRPDVPRVVNPAAGLLSNLEDMLSFVRAHTTIDPGQLNPDALASMQHARITGGSVGPVAVDHIGVGWMLLDIDGETVLMSQGGDSGLISAMIAVPSHQFGMVVLANSDTAMMLVNEAVLHGMSTFTGLTLPEPGQHMLTSDEAANVTGEFGLREWMTFTIGPADGSITVAASAGGQVIPDMSGQFTMTSSTRGFMPYQGGRLWIDLVPDDTGSIQWLRFAGRLVPRVE